MKFFTVFFGVCKGTEIFFQLFRQSLIRALWHLLLLSLICATFITGIKSFKFMSDIDTACNIVNEQCGGVSITDKGIFPAVEPEKARLFQIPEGMSVCYLPKGFTQLPDFDRNEVDEGILWTPGLVINWIKTQSNDYFFLPVMYSELNVGLQLRSYQKNEIAEVMKKNGYSGAAINIPYNFSDNLSMAVKLYVTWRVFVWNFIPIIFQAILFIAIFSLIFNLMSAKRLKTVKLRDLFVLGIYASFPAMVVASFFPALDLPLLSYNEAYLLGFTCYLMVIINRIERRLNPVEKNNNEQNDLF
ncbi:MAG: hypothetical protein WC071_03465 [Victivallaceae bacterium]